MTTMLKLSHRSPDILLQNICLLDGIHNFVYLIQLSVPEDEKQPRNIVYPLPCITVDKVFLLEQASLFFLPNIMLIHETKKYLFSLISSENCFSELFKLLIVVSSKMLMIFFSFLGSRVICLDAYVRTPPLRSPRLIVRTRTWVFVLSIPFSRSFALI